MSSIGVGGERTGKGAVALPPNSGEKNIFGQTSCNIQAVDIFLEEGRTGIFLFFDSTCILFSFHVYVN